MWWPGTSIRGPPEKGPPPAGRSTSSSRRSWPPRGGSSGTSTSTCARRSSPAPPVVRAGLPPLRFYLLRAAGPVLLRERVVLVEHPAEPEQGVVEVGVEHVLVEPLLDVVRA